MLSNCTVSVDNMYVCLTVLIGQGRFKERHMLMYFQGKFQGSYWKVSREFQWFQEFQEVSREFQGRFKGVLGKFPREFLKSFKDVSRC